MSRHFAHIAVYLNDYQPRPKYQHLSNEVKLKQPELTFAKH